MGVRRELRYSSLVHEHSLLISASFAPFAVQIVFLCSLRVLCGSNSLASLSLRLPISAIHDAFEAAFEGAVVKVDQQAEV